MGAARVLLDGMADGRIFIGQQALKAGLIDAVGDFDAAIEIASQFNLFDKV